MGCGRIAFGKTTLYLTHTINDRNGQPYGWIWLTLIVLRGPGKKDPPNRRLFPVGYIKRRE